MLRSIVSAMCAPPNSIEVLHATPENDFDSLPLKKTDTATSTSVKAMSISEKLCSKVLFTLACMVFPMGVHVVSYL